MANYVQLREGDHLPTVGVLQKLLNRTGAKLAVDGAFGSRTREAVKAFQAARGLVPDGVAGEATWSRIVHAASLPIVDCVDVFDKALYDGDARNIRNVGGDPILIGGMSRGVVQAASMIRARASNAFLLRFIGHGNSGIQIVAAGKGGVGEQRSNLHVVNARVAHELGLGSIFGPYGSVELHGCHVARGAQGHEFVTTLADAWGVPVSAGVQSQYSTFRFDGPTFTACPGRQKLSRWCAGLPDFPSISVP